MMNAAAADDIALHITDISDEVLAAVAKFLPKPSQALFAMAMTAPSPSWRESDWNRPPSTTSREIVLHPTENIQEQGQEQEHGGGILHLEFAEIESSLAERLTDDDIGGMLVCIDGVNRLKSLKLTGCVSITGHGLKPLRGSTVIEQIDLSLVGKHECPNILTDPLISESAVLPILDSIIEIEGNSLKQLQLPKKFRSNPSQLLDDFIERYGNEHLEQFGDMCSKCNVDDWGRLDNLGTSWVQDDRESLHYGLQNYTCYECTGHFCIESCILRCNSCEKDFCTDCIEVAECANCPAKLCEGCGELKKCANCGDDVCETCCSLCGCCDKVIRCEECVPYYTCEYDCGRAHCSSCSNYTKGNDVEKCVGCGTEACSRCRLLEYQRNPAEIPSCTPCFEIINRVQHWHDQMGLPFI